VDYEVLTEHPSTIYPYRLVNMAFEYMVHIPHRFMDPAAHDHVLDLFLLELPEISHPAPSSTWWILGRLVGIRSLPSGKKAPDLPVLPGPTPLPTHTKRSSRCFPGFRGAIFTISTDEPSYEGEMDQERAARVERNVDRMARRVGRENAEETRANIEGWRPIQCDLADAFDMCGNHKVHKTPSANIAIAMNELAKLP
jgi:hypothetical protein